MFKKWLCISLALGGLYSGVSIYGMNQHNSLPSATDSHYYGISIAPQKITATSGTAAQEKDKKEHAIAIQQAAAGKIAADSNDQETNAIKDILKKEYNLSYPTPALEKAVYSAFKACNIDPKSIILMQNNDTNKDYDGQVSNPFIWSKLHLSHKVSSKKIMIITCDGPHFSLFTIYHECGHIVHKDCSLFNAVKDGVLAASCYALTKAVLPTSGLVAGGIRLGVSGSMVQWLLHAKERAANNFATHKLIEQKNYTPLIETFKELSKEKESRIKNFIFSVHDTEYDQAHDILKLLLSYQVDIFDLVTFFGLSHQPSSQAQQEAKEWLACVKESFPQIYSQFLKRHEDAIKKDMVIVQLPEDALLSPQKKNGCTGLMDSLKRVTSYMAFKVWNNK